jgi:hypothetical protein
MTSFTFALTTPASHPYKPTKKGAIMAAAAPPKPSTPPPQKAELVVFDDLKGWFPPVQHSQFTVVPKINLNVRIPYEYSGPPEQVLLIKKYFGDEFDAKFDSISKAEFGALQGDINKLDQELQAAVKPGSGATGLSQFHTKEQVLAAQKGFEAKIKAFNGKLQSRFDAWVNQVKNLANACFETALKKSAKDLGGTPRKVNWKLVCLILLAMAFAIAAGPIGILVAAAATTGVALAVAGASVALVGTLAAAVVSCYQIKDEWEKGKETWKKKKGSD